MRRATIAVIDTMPNAKLAAAAERAGGPAVGTRLTADLVVRANCSALAHACDVRIDFTTPAALQGNLDAAVTAGHAIVIGATGGSSQGTSSFSRRRRNVQRL